MAPDRLNLAKIEIRDVNRNGTWVEWKCNIGLPRSLENINNSLIALRDEGKRINGKGIAGRDTLLSVVYYDHRERPDPQYVSFNSEGKLPIDLSLVKIPYEKWRPVAVEIDSSLIFVRFHLKQSKDFVTKTNQTLDWNKAVVVGVDTFTRYNMSLPISKLIHATIPESPSQEIIANYLQEELSIYP